MANENELRAYLKKAILELQDTQQRLDDVEFRAHEPIAIVGMACRYPGGIESPESLWAAVAEGRDLISEWPTDRGWDVDGLYDPDNPGREGKSYVRVGGFVHDATKFDAAFFGISPREALAMDPRQRTALESVWEAIEYAGIDPTSLRGSDTGVYLGMMSDFYGPLTMEGGREELDGVLPFLMTGQEASVASGRVAYALGLQGPAVTLDTACSSSLVAVHHATQSLRSGECSLALAIGVTMMASPVPFVGFSLQRALAPDGRSKSFAAAADGTTWSEGVGTLLLERLSDARRHGHPVWAVVRGSAVNQDGTSNGLTAPNGVSQQRVIRQALANAGVAAHEVDVVEAHGTGTVLGDPIEAQALLATYGQNRPAGQPLWLGSIKSNMGHTQAAAGVAGIIKLVEAMRHDVAPPTLHVDAPTPHVDWSSGQVRLLTEAQPWRPRADRPRRGAVSSFGISGTNSHVIVEEPPQEASAAAAPAFDRSVPAAVPWVVSAKSDQALTGQAAKLLDFVRRDPDLDAVDVGWSLLSRAVFEHRAVIVGRDKAELVAGLTALAEGRDAPGVVRGRADAGAKTVFLFPGQGTQWAGMAAGMLASSPVFEAELRRCAQYFAELVDWSLLDVLDGVPGAPDLQRIDVVPPVLFAVMVSLAAVWRSLGVEPDGVIGHSQGEIAAAYVAGGLPLRDAARLIVQRSRALTDIAGTGAMISVPLELAKARERITPWGERLSVAAVNGPAATVVSGEVAAIDEILAELVTEGISARRIAVNYASHSAQIDLIHTALVESMDAVQPVSTATEFISAVSGDPVDTGGLDLDYWFRNLREPVRFDKAVHTAYELGYRGFVECGPHPVLSVGVEQFLDGVDDHGDVLVTGSLRRDDGGLDRFLVSVAQAYVRGAPVDWSVLFAGTGARRITLPTYAFDRKYYWLEPAGDANVTAAGLQAAQHPLLGAALTPADGGGLILSGRLSLQSHRWLADHRVGGSVLLPGAALVELALHVGELVDAPVLGELILQSPLVIPESGAVELQVVAGGAQESGDRSVSVYSRPQVASEEAAGSWTSHAVGVLRADGDEALDDDEFGTWPPAGAVAVELGDIGEVYAGLATLGYRYGPVFQGLKAVWRRGDSIFAEVALPESARGEAERFGLHPALLDAALHAVIVTATAGVAGEVRLPFSWEGVALEAVGASSLRVKLVANGPDSIALTLADPAGGMVARVASLTTRSMSLESLGAVRGPMVDDALFGLNWVPVAPADDMPAATWQSLHGNGSGNGAAVAERCVVAERAHTVIRCFAGVGAGPEVAAPIRTRTVELLNRIRDLLADPQSTAPIVAVTSGAVPVHGMEDITDFAGAAVWGLLRSAQNENPGRIMLIDVDDPAGYRDAVTTALGIGEEPQLALRGGAASAPRLVRAGADTLGAPDLIDRGDWQMVTRGRGTLHGDNLLAGENRTAGTALAPGQVRIELRAAGMNFRDVLIVLGMYPIQDTPVGGEGAGVVIEIGPDVTDLAVGDRVMGMFPGIGATVIADQRVVTRMPAGWSFAEAASVPVVFATAYHALVDLAEVRAGQSLLVHSATGGVGMAAVQLARHLGLELYVTASLPKWNVLRDMGFEDGRISDTRSLDFEAKFLGATEGRGVDVVLDSLAGDKVDASLRLLPRGGRFIEMGVTDVREPGDIADRYPGVDYRQFMLPAVGPERLHEIMVELVRLFESGVLRPVPVTEWDVRRAPEALRFLSQARHIGKNVLTMPRRLDPNGSVLVTGGTGGLGGVLARHLVAAHGVRHLVLTSRRGLAAEGAAELVAELSESGAAVDVVACDVTDRAAVDRLISGIDAEHPLTAVVHAAGVLDDALFTAQTPESVAKVFGPKVDAAWHLHEATRELPLAAFVLYSSIAGVLGAPGQSNYAAANAVLDALAQHRRVLGLPATSMVWGFWSRATGMTGHMQDADRDRMRRGGFAGISDADGMALFDAALRSGQTLIVPARIDVATLRKQGGDIEDIPPLLRGLLRSARRVADGGSVESSKLVASLLGLSRGEQQRIVLEAIRAHAAAVLGHESSDAVPPDTAFMELGFDSLGAVEFRNRLQSSAGVKLPTTVVFDYPTSMALARYLTEEIAPADNPAARLLDQVDSLTAAWTFAELAPSDQDALAARLDDLARRIRARAPEAADADLTGADDDAIFDFIDQTDPLVDSGGPH
ncbi:SDR family NAD(P)-dependent oxidoreductase [Nocardia sp. NPDC006044]|uniref:SDR family NAD(P)-dependent oxidoreductase n=1 Tax=Nocardia sp. NPDC006044 TaxID=3364306 RepID=UPI0036BA53A0